MIVAMLSDGASHSSLLFFKIVIPVLGPLLSCSDFRVRFLFPLIFFPCLVLIRIPLAFIN